MIDTHTAIFAAYPNVITIYGDIFPDVKAIDADENEVIVDSQIVEAKKVELLAEYQAKQQAKADAKQSALAKLSKLGLTQDEVVALIG
jgi:hypothetical protein